MRTLLSLVMALLAPLSPLAAATEPATAQEQDAPRPTWTLALREVLEPGHPGYREAEIVQHRGEELRLGPPLELRPARGHLAADELGSPALAITPAAEDAARLREWTAARIGARVAAFVDGELRVTPVLTSALSGPLVVTGFEREELLDLLGDDPELRPYDLVLRVVDGRSGAPIEGVRIELPVEGSVRALGASRFEVHVPLPEQTHRLEVTAPGYHPVEALVARGRDTLLQELVVELLPPARLEGRVIDAAGQPVAGLRISLESTHGSVVAPRWAPESGWMWSHAEGITDGQGRFLLAELPAGDHRLALVGRHPDRDSEAPHGWLGVLPRHVSLAPGATTFALLRLPPRRVVTGLVVDEEGQPVADLDVALLPRDPEADWPALLPEARYLADMGLAFVATTDASGAFRFAAVPEGAYHLGTPRGGAAGAVAQPIVVDARSAERPQRLVAGRRLVTGHVEGREHTTLFLSARPAGAPDDPLFWQEVAAGPFQLGPLPAGRYRIDVLDWFSTALPAGPREVEAGDAGVLLSIPEPARLLVVPRLDGARHGAHAWVERIGAGGVMGVEEVQDQPLEAWPHEQTLVVRTFDGRIGAVRVTPRAGEEREVEVPLEQGAVLRVRVGPGAHRPRLAISRGELTYATLLPGPGVQHVLLVPTGSLVLRLADAMSNELLLTLPLDLDPGADESIELQL